MPFAWRFVIGKAWVAPGRTGEVPVLPETGNDMPVQVRHHITELGQIDLVRAEQVSLNRFHAKYIAHEGYLICRGQVGHFLDVLLPYDAGIAGVVRFIGIDDANLLILPNERFIAGPAQDA
mgnify:CR=1 FL=1